MTEWRPPVVDKDEEARRRAAGMCIQCGLLKPAAGLTYRDMPYVRCRPCLDKNATAKAAAGQRAKTMRPITVSVVDQGGKQHVYERAASVHVVCE